jgi:hypothetical protein
MRVAETGAAEVIPEVTEADLDEPVVDVKSVAAKPTAPLRRKPVAPTGGARRGAR